MRIILSWKGIGIDWRTSKLILIDAGKQPTGVVSDVEHHMEAHPIAIKVQEDIDQEFRDFRKTMRGKLLQIFPVPS
jgi:hypothetical protein